MCKIKTVLLCIVVKAESLQCQNFTASMEIQDNKHVLPLNNGQLLCQSKDLPSHN